MKLKGVKSKLIILITLSIIVSVSLNSIFLIRLASNEFKTSTQNRLLDYISVYQKSVSNYFDNLSMNISMNRQLKAYITGEDTFSQNQQLNPFPITNNEENSSINPPLEDMPNTPFSTNETSMDDLLTNLSYIYSDALWINYCDPEGQVLNSTDSSQLETSLANEDFFTRILSGTLHTQSEARTYNDTYYFYFAVGITDSDSNVDGIICIAFPTEYLANVLSSSSTTLPSAIGPNSTPQNASANEEENLQALEMQGIETATAYIIDGNGLVTYTTNSNLAEPTTNNQLFTQLSTALTNDSLSNNISFGEYTLDGLTKYYSCSLIPSTNWILAIDVLQVEINKPIRSITLISLLIIILLVIISVIITNVFASKIVKPISLTTHLLQKLAKLDFTALTVPTTHLPSDETGIMLESINTVATEFKRVITELEGFTTTLSKDSIDLSTISSQLTANVEENSCHTQEVSAGMEETTSTYHALTDHIADIRNNTQIISKSLNDNITSCEHMLQTVSTLKENSIHASSSTKAIYDSAKQEIDSALKGASAVSKINHMADIISNIANQTSLLALNASIEAARAGESGRGFTVVATEIGHLAEQSATTVSAIGDTIQEVNTSVELLKNMLIKILNFIDEKVLLDYQSFENISDEYNSDANHFSTEMCQMNELISTLLSTLTQMDESLDNVAITLESSSTNVYSIAEKNTEIVEVANKTTHMAQCSNDKVTRLKELVNQFKLS